MAIITKYFLAEQVQRLLAAGDPGVADKVHIDEIKAAVNNVINVQLKAEHFSQTLPGGETIPEGLSLCTYDNVAVTTYKGVSKAVLPVMPVSLPRNLGVYHVGKTDNLDCGFIPIQSGQFAFIKVQRQISTILDQTGYYPEGREIFFTTDLTAGTPAITAVLMKLVVMDISKYSDYEMLPLPADMVWSVLTEVYKMFSSEQMPAKIVDSNQENK